MPNNAFYKEREEFILAFLRGETVTYKINTFYTEAEVESLSIFDLRCEIMFKIKKTPKYIGVFKDRYQRYRFTAKYYESLEEMKEDYPLPEVPILLIMDSKKFF